MSNSKNNTASADKVLAFIKEWLWAIIIAAAGIALAAVTLISSACTGAPEVSPFADKPSMPDSEKFTVAEDGAQLQPPTEGEQVAVLETDKGVIKMRLFPEQAPLACENFVGLIKQGYYDGLTFHRVIDNFMIQGGDPAGTGGGGESIWGKDFKIENERNLYNIRGALCMANAGGDTNGSQFYIVQMKTCDVPAEEFVKIGYPQWAADAYAKNGGAYWLDAESKDAEWISNASLRGGRYTVFGQVFQGMDVVDAIAAVETDANSKPLTDVIVVKAYMETYTAPAADAQQ